MQLNTRHKYLLCCSLGLNVFVFRQIRILLQYEYNKELRLLYVEDIISFTDEWEPERFNLRLFYQQQNQTPASTQTTLRTLRYTTLPRLFNASMMVISSSYFHPLVFIARCSESKLSFMCNHFLSVIFIIITILVLWQ